MTSSYNDKIAVFAGSFNPFTIGHADIVRRGLEIFDRIIICVGVNANKPDGRQDAEQRAQAIRYIYAGDSRVAVLCNEGLTAEFALELGACALLRGVRSVKDFEYERDMADANRQLAGIETVILYSSPEYAWVSSSLVRELASYGKDISRFIPTTQKTQPS